MERVRREGLAFQHGGLAGLAAAACARLANALQSRSEIGSAYLVSAAGVQVSHARAGEPSLGLDQRTEMARMRFEILLAQEAVDDLKRLSARERVLVRRALEMRLRSEQHRVSQGRIKRLRGLSRPQFRLRVGDVRVFYDVSDDAVQVLAILAKGDAEKWLQEVGEIL
jgi:mRNA interferase RelE/StbE